MSRKGEGHCDRGGWRRWELNGVTGHGGPTGKETGDSHEGYVERVRRDGTELRSRSAQVYDRSRGDTGRSDSKHPRLGRR